MLSQDLGVIGAIIPKILRFPLLQDFLHFVKTALGIFTALFYRAEKAAEQTAAHDAARYRQDMSVADAEEQKIT